MASLPAFADTESLLTQTQNLDPKGHLVYCQHRGFLSVEFLFGETVNGDYLLEVRSNTYDGHTLGGILKRDIDSDFTSKMERWGFIQFTAHIPKLYPGSEKFSPPITVCRFASTSAALLTCDLTGSAANSAELTDGARTESLDVHDMTLSTVHEVTDTADRRIDRFGLNYYFDGKGHPFPQGFKGLAGFDPSECKTR